MENSNRSFNRTHDVSKLEGCNTRGIEYRWQIFSREIATMPIGGNALDFGAGSLRESFDLAIRGFNVTSIDLSNELLASYKAAYRWPENGTTHKLIESVYLTDGLAKLDSRKFDLVTCFDVLEHVDDPSIVLRELGNLMSDDGKILITVPNGRSLFEIAWRIDLLIARATKRHLRPGEPHLQRNSPGKWKRIIEEAGFSIVRHEMAIGFFANTVAALVQLPLTLGGRFLRKMGLKFDAIGLSDRICSGGLMAAVYRLDQKTEMIFRPLYGWNLLVGIPARKAIPLKIPIPLI
jgi:2-polyprenyl-3-methyl-5-hydroxy-6-metoxy-1,4-benzoquinol methylase